MHKIFYHKFSLKFELKIIGHSTHQKSFESFVLLSADRSRVFASSTSARAHTNTSLPPSLPLTHTHYTRLRSRGLELTTAKDGRASSAAAACASFPALILSLPLPRTRRRADRDEGTRNARGPPWRRKDKEWGKGDGFYQEQTRAWREGKGENRGRESEEKNDATRVKILSIANILLGPLAKYGS